MADYTLKIESLSDLCVSDGGIYNSSLDLDICHDAHGFPYIPAKRIKGCLKESAQELSDWGVSIPSGLFGSAGGFKNAAWLTLSDAVLEDAGKFSSEIDSSNSPVYHPQNVLGLYSYVRTQTSINHETGVAKRKSLRTMRVSNKNLIFIGTLHVSNPETGGFASEEEEKNILDAICANLTHMGNSRTRGLGEVKVTIEPSADERKEVTDAEKTENATVLSYEILLNEPVICKSIIGAESNSQDYIDGGKILGVIAGRYRTKNHKEVSELLNKGMLEFSNAYISSNGKRYTEVPGYVYAIKNEKSSYINKLYDQKNEAAKDRQLNSMKHTYVDMKEDGTLAKKDVALEQRYHHRRPEDKSIGRASKNDSDNSSFYQLSSISAGQTFRGFIKGTPDQIAEVYDLLVSDEQCRLGYGSASEYGRCTITQIRTCKEQAKKIEADEVLITLQSPAIVYNKHAMYSADVNDLKAEILAACGIDSKTEVEITRYVKYTNVGGYNVTWNKRKPTVIAFDKGTALVLKFREKQTFTLSDPIFLGERTIEGFGEFSVSEITAKETAEYPISKKTSTGQAEKIDFSNSPFANRISVKLFDEFIHSEAITLANGLKKDKYRPTVSNMILMCNETSDYVEIKKTVEDRYGKKSAKKADKLKMANEILDLVEANEEKVISSFAEKFDIVGFQPLNNTKYDLLKAVLQQIKYNIRGTELKSGKEAAGNE